MSFLSCEARSRLGKENRLVKLSLMLDWERIGSKLYGIYAYDVNGNGGQKPYDSVKMFKAVLLGQWHGRFPILLCFLRMPIKSHESGTA